MKPGVRYFTVFFRTKPGAPTNSRQLLAQAGAIHQSRFQGKFPSALTLPKDQVQALRAIDWMNILEVDSSPPVYPVSDSPRTGSVSVLRMAQITPWGLTNIGADSVQIYKHFSGTGVKVAVLDQGAWVTNPDLDIVGCHDYFGAGSGCVVQGPHGTKVAGVIGAQNNSILTLGIAPDADLYSVRVCDLAGCPGSAVYDGLVWAKSHGMDVVNLSLGSCGGEVGFTTSVLLYAMASDGIIVVAAGGNGIHNDPPCDEGEDVSKYAVVPFTIGVSAYGSGLTYKSGYQYGPEIDFAGPTDVYTTGSGTTPVLLGGTSGATPHVTGAIALMMDADFPHDLIYQRLKETTFQPESPPHNDHYGWGEIKVNAAIATKPGVDSLTWCTGSAITNPGSCQIRAYFHGGIAPIQIQFEVMRSDQSGIDTLGWGGATRTIQVGAGDYTLSITATPREQTYKRIGFYNIQDIPVCTSQGANASNPGTNAVGGCSGGGGGDDF